MSKKTAAELDEKGYCLVCKKAKPNRRRGLCQQHYHQFRRQKLALKEEDQEEFERRIIEAGLILEAKKPGPQVDANPFSAFTDGLEVSEEPSFKDQASDVESRADEVSRKFSKKATPKKKPGKKAGEG